MNDSIASNPLSETPTGKPAEASTPPPRAQQIAQSMAWIGFGLFCLLFFTWIKLPQDRIKNYVQGLIAAQLAPKGINFSAERGYVSLGWGVSYVMKNVTINLPPPEAAAHIDRIEVSPSLVPLIFGYQGGSISLEQGEGSFSASVSMKGTNVSGSFKTKKMDLGKIAILPMAAGIHGSVMATGKGAFSGDFSVPSTLSVDLDMTLGKVVLDPQMVMGFSVPQIQASEGRLEMFSEKGKAMIKTFKLGKAGGTDDIQASGTGDILLGRNWDSSTLNSRLSVKFSESLMKAFVFVDAILGPGKQPDGSYLITLSGSLTAPQFLPVGPGSK
ncbi:type II secretion system protein GspN [Bdellovibrionota bacterium FG-1]